MCELVTKLFRKISNRKMLPLEKITLYMQHAFLNKDTLHKIHTLGIVKSLQLHVDVLSLFSGGNRIKKKLTTASTSAGTGVSSLFGRPSTAGCDVTPE